MNRQITLNREPLDRRAQPIASVSQLRALTAAIAGVLSVACSSGSPTATLSPEDEPVSMVSTLRSDETALGQPTAEAERLGSSCLQITDVNPIRADPGDTAEVEVRCLFTSNPNRVRVTFGADGDSPVTVRADEILSGSFFNTPIVVTVPLGATTGQVKVNVGLFRSATSERSIQIFDEGILWRGEGVKFRVREDMSQVISFSFEQLSGETSSGESCTFGGSGSFNNPLDIDPVDGMFSIDAGPFEISGEFTSDISAEGTVIRDGCIAGWSASPFGL